MELAKFYFGTEFQSRTPEEKEAILRQDKDASWDDNEPSNAEGNDWWSQQPADAQAPDEDSNLTYKDVLDWLDRRQDEESARGAFVREMMNAGWSRERAEERWQVYKLNEGVARGVAGAMTVQSAIAGARAILAGAYRWAVSLGEVGAVGKSAGPGKWVEVVRPRGIEHQSKMSGKPIIERDGKRYIEEYLVPSEPKPVYFDDFRNGIFYEYKGPQGNLLNRNKLFGPWYRGAIDDRNQALAQARAAKGAPVIWRVGADQVKAFEAIVGDIKGITIVP